MSIIYFKGKHVNTNKSFFKSGKAPDFVLTDKDLSDKSLKDFPGKKLLSINPSFDTSVCSKTAKHLEEIAKKNPELKIILISKDLPFAQSRFCKSENLKNITMLSMMHSDKFAKDYGILMEDGPLKGLTARAIFLINENNEIIYSELVEEVTNEPDYITLEKHLV